jgi:uncharacterized protein with ParB-like and HNH nuclease domain
LDYHDRKISIQNRNVLEFIQFLAAGRFLIPTFQRPFVWNPEDIIRLWDSLYQRYPIGSILCWNTNVRLHVHRKPGGFYSPEDGNPKQEMHSYILDGQQRVTALLTSFYGGTGQVRDRFSFDFTLYFDLTRAVFFFEKDYYKHRAESDAAFLIRLHDAQNLPPYYCMQYSERNGFLPAVEKNLEQLRFLFSDYAIPLIHLEGFDVADVCAIYERMNQTGMRLQNIDILIARGFKNYPTVVEEDFPVS